MKDNLWIYPAIGTEFSIFLDGNYIDLLVIGSDKNRCNGCYFYENRGKVDCSKLLKNINCANRIFVENCED